MMTRTYTITVKEDREELTLIFDIDAWWYDYDWGQDSAKISIEIAKQTVKAVYQALLTQKGITDYEILNITY